MTTQEIRKAIRNMEWIDTIEINGRIVKRSGKAYGLRIESDDPYDNEYTIFYTQREIIEALS